MKRRTERTTPNPRPIDERTIREEMARSHYELKIELVGTVLHVEMQQLRVGVPATTTNRLTYLLIKKSLAHGLG